MFLAFLPVLEGDCDRLGSLVPPTLADNITEDGGVVLTGTLPFEGGAGASRRETDLERDLNLDTELFDDRRVAETGRRRGNPARVRPAPIVVVAAEEGSN